MTVQPRSVSDRTTLGADQDHFPQRHIGPRPADRDAMLRAIGVSSLEELIDQTIPPGIRSSQPLALPEPEPEHAFLGRLREIAQQNRVCRSYIGMGYYDCIVPGVIRRMVLENPGWYTPYTPYQAEVAQGRLESLLNFQTMVRDLTGMEIANASLLDEATAAAEAMSMAWRVQAREGAEGRRQFLVSTRCFPQAIAVVRNRAEPIGIDLDVRDISAGALERDTKAFGVLLQYPDDDGAVTDLSPIIDAAHRAGLLVVVASDLLALTLLRPPGEMGADIVVGNSQRFGVPLGYGGPHAAFFATRERFIRQAPGRIIGVSVDAHGRTAYRMAIQTREQHIRRERATSNICTAQALLANMAAMYAVYHGPNGLTSIARRVHALASLLHQTLRRLGYAQLNDQYFDTLKIDPGDSTGLQTDRIRRGAAQAGLNFRYFRDGSIGMSVDETTTTADLAAIASIFAAAKERPSALAELDETIEPEPYPPELERASAFLTHPVFNSHHSETEMMRYIRGLERKDIGLDTSMIPLGSCTMKLNAATEMMPVTWPEFSRIHPFAPAEQAQGYRQIFRELEAALTAITGLAAVSLQPNSGAQGELAGLLAIRGYHHGRGQPQRTVVLIPSSAHGTNPASAVMAGMQVVVVLCDAGGDVDLNDLREKAAAHRDRLAALMITYPSTHGVYEAGIREMCAIVHEHGGQVYMDGANLNAQVGLTSPAAIGADVCHLNLHKTFSIPHGGGGPGMGPIAVARHLAPYLPGHPLAGPGDRAIPPVAAAPWGSASILVISYAYIRLLGGSGCTDATRYAILNANYMKARLERHYPVLFAGAGGRVAHELIFDLRGFKEAAGIDEQDVAKRLMDYGFHAPTVSFPVAGTLMVEPTESESQDELDRFCDAMISIRQEIQDVIDGKAHPRDNVLRNAPHTAEEATADVWTHPYSRERAVYPLPFVKAKKFWPSVGRIDNPYGDRNLFCACPPTQYP
ncbi:MAG: aminomethyl-transferring glycine dehydrogenase [Acidobacteria bacterium]|nr:aminomethyl-transferring glycine dehydrogenase [Acidobacteriota bacterium]